MHAHALSRPLASRSYISRPWYSLQQAVTSYQPRDSFYCVRAEYRRSPNDASRLLVFNQGRKGSVSGPLQGGAQLLLNAVVRDESRGKLAVGPPFLPPSTYGPYWVVAAGPSQGGPYEWAVISGGPPTQQGANGTCTNTRSGTPGVGAGEGLWLFSRTPTQQAGLLAQLRNVAADKGFDLSVLSTVDQSGCSYVPFPDTTQQAPPPFGAFSG